MSIALFMLSLSLLCRASHFCTRDREERVERIATLMRSQHTSFLLPPYALKSEREASGSDIIYRTHTCAQAHTLSWQKRSTLSSYLATIAPRRSCTILVLGSDDQRQRVPRRNA